MASWRTHRLRAAALAWVAALALAVLPTLSRALQTLPPVASWADLCRSDGGDARLHHALDACGHCALAQQPALPSGTGPAAPPAIVHGSAGVRLDAGRPAGPVAAAAPARAPPRAA